VALVKRLFQSAYAATPDELRQRMVERQLARRGIEDGGVLQAMGEVPRESFVSDALVEFAYDDTPLPIGENQTISQPYVVALMLEAVELQSGDRVLDIGTGSGYAAAIASRIVGQVISVERHASLAETARKTIQKLGYTNVEIHVGDGSRGWSEGAPFDAILVAAGSPEVPQNLLDQLAPGGRGMRLVNHFP
jgi:protein-L-isoaspartate(D-aspartate) O-methyltransferase